MKPSSATPTVWMTSREACEYLRFTGKDRLHSLYAFLNAKGVPRYYRSTKSLMLKQSDLDRALECPESARRRNRIKAA